MRISGLVERTGVPLATVKYYLREGLLPPGRAVGAKLSLYGEEHVRRLALIRALRDTANLPLARVRTIVALIDEPADDLLESLGRAVAALPPAVADDRQGPYPRAEGVAREIGPAIDPGSTAMAQLEDALAAAESVGLGISAERARLYAQHLRAMAEFDIAQVPTGDRGRAIEYSVLGTAIYEPVIAAMRRLAHQDVARSARDDAGDR
ncbi:MerR family transcriptional regulator [Zhihengliuella salsuginis]|uniref:Transcriptional regulator n=1 Tax=Zhihengliuella salsuginis TaxID=578222 RepID=A0ABQ3GHK5_9MICC|nr:MerR family transcriptional regulator [Zhihengliuella salsuginis]GHD07161.1 transcriptional regulator [Zhihengliuella salsuginis]